ncbi:MAG: hypothetical protein IJZ75_04680 [Clostridia bacterium]|nr:hypothetical protein [Clostridia bacterium]
MLENDEKLSDEELLDLVGAGILCVELDVFRLLAKNTKNEITEVTGLQLQSDSDMDETINQVILDYISFVLTQGEISEIEYKFITKILKMKYTKESLNEYLLTARIRDYLMFERTKCFLSILHNMDEMDINKGKLLPYLIKFLVKIDASYIHGDDSDFDQNLWLKNHLLYFENLSKWYKSGFEF